VKDDVEIPPTPPRKRRALEQALPQWLAMWANDESLPPSQRRRAQAERDRRKRLVPDVIVGVIVGEEGMTPAQRGRLLELIAAARATELHHDWSRSSHMRRLLLPLDDLNVRVVPQQGDHELVRNSTTVVAVPKDVEKPDRVEGVWEAVRYAKHRRLPVRVVMPDGNEHE
jgi:hypothetical protein